jgi:hypothetical protein
MSALSLIPALEAEKLHPSYKIPAVGSQEIFGRPGE